MAEEGVYGWMPPKAHCVNAALVALLRDRVADIESRPLRPGDNQYFARALRKVRTVPRVCFV